MSVTTTGYHDDGTALFVRGFRRGHSLNSLVNVLVKRISAICRNSNFRRNLMDCSEGFHKVTTHFVRFFHISCKRTDDFLIGIQNDVHNESQLCLPCCPHHVFVNGIVGKISRSGIRRINKFTGMVCHNRLIRSDSRKNSLSSTGEAGEEMRLDKSFCNKKVRLCCHFIDNAIAAGRKLSNLHHILILLGKVHYNLFMIGNLGTILVHEFFVCRRTVEPGRNQDTNPCLRRNGPNSL